MDSLTNLDREPARIGPWSSTTSRFIQQRLNGMLRHEIAASDRQVVVSLSGKLPSSRRRGDLATRPMDSRGANRQGLSRHIRIPRHGVAAILDEAGRQVALGTVVDADGWVITSAGTLPAEPKCRLSDAQVLVAQVVGVNPAFNLALLRVPVTNLPLIRWAEKPPPVAGTILAAAGSSETPLAIGVVSVLRRNLPGPFPTRIAQQAPSGPRCSGSQRRRGPRRLRPKRSPRSGYPIRRRDPHDRRSGYP